MLGIDAEFVTAPMVDLLTFRNRATNGLESKDVSTYPLFANANLAVSVVFISRMAPS